MMAKSKEQRYLRIYTPPKQKSYYENYEKIFCKHEFEKTCDGNKCKKCGYIKTS